MYINTKWKPTFKDIEKYLNDMDQFKKDIENIEKLTGVIIHINQKCNSVYFDFKNYKYRVSTHDKINKKYSNDQDLFKGDKQINKVTNSRKNIIKYVKKILGVKDE